MIFTSRIWWFSCNISVWFRFREKMRFAKNAKLITTRTTTFTEVNLNIAKKKASIIKLPSASNIKLYYQLLVDDFFLCIFFVSLFLTLWFLRFFMLLLCDCYFLGMFFFENVFSLATPRSLCLYFSLLSHPPPSFSGLGVILLPLQPPPISYSYL